MGIYLDYNASTPIDNHVLETMVDIYKNSYGNADSRTHSFGSQAKTIVETARAEVASLLGVKKEEVYFTSGSTESNNLAILGLEEYGKYTGRMHIITTAIEHKSVLEPLRILKERGFDVEYVFPHEDGRVHTEDILEKVKENTLLVSVMHVNNETGTIQPVQEIGEALKEKETLFHIDASQSCGKLVEEIWQLTFDLMSVSSHKMYGPQGVGALIVRKNYGKQPKLQAIMYGGGQERGLRPGTLPTPLIGGFGAAADLLVKRYKENQKLYKRNKALILKKLNERHIQYLINGDLAYSIDTTLNISFFGYDSEALMLAVKDMIGVSNGSACTSHSYEPSYVLKAMGLDKKRVAEAVRISWGKDLIEEEVVEKIIEIVKEWQG